MKKIKLIPIEVEDELDDFDDYEDFDTEEGLHFEFDLTPYLITCAMACAMLFVVRFVQKYFFSK